MYFLICFASCPSSISLTVGRKTRADWSTQETTCINTGSMSEHFKNQTLGNFKSSRTSSGFQLSLLTWPRDIVVNVTIRCEMFHWVPFSLSATRPRTLRAVSGAASPSSDDPSTSKSNHRLLLAPRKGLVQLHTVVGKYLFETSVAASGEGCCSSRWQIKSLKRPRD